MSEASKRKLKLIYLLRILETQTDAEQGLTMPQIIERLEAEGIPAERKSLYKDIDTLEEAGYRILRLPKRPVEYALVRNELDFDEVMMLIDAVQSSRFLTERKANQLVKNLKSLVSKRERKLLEKRVHVSNRINNQSESVFHSVDIIHEALQKRKKIEFLYFSYDTDFKRKPRHEGKRYVLTPVKVIYSDGNYYLAAFDDGDRMIKTYRIDRMELLQMSDEKATRSTEIANYEFDEFKYKSFSMFRGEPRSVTLHVDAKLVDAVVDQFGHEVDVVSSSSKSTDIRTLVQVSPQFFGWIAGLNGGVTLKAPKSVVDEYHSWLESLK